MRRQKCGGGGRARKREKYNVGAVSRGVQSVEEGIDDDWKKTFLIT